LRAPGTLREARRWLIEHGEVPASLVGETIARSWHRCLTAGCQPTDRPDPPSATPGQLALSTDRRRELLTTAAPVMAHVHGQIVESGSMVILADDRGVLLHALGDPDFVSRAERVSLMPGASWLEPDRGTNAIGTALAESHAVVVHGGEHFLERNAFLTCSAAPIRDPLGRLLGVLDISGDYRFRHPHTFGLVRTAAQMVENRLFHDRHDAHLRVHLHVSAHGIGTVAEGLIAFDADGAIVGANAAGLELLGIDYADLRLASQRRLLDVSCAEFADWARRHGQRPMAVRRRDGTMLYAAAEWARPTGVAAARPMRALGDALGLLDSGDERLALAIDRARRVIDKPVALLLHGETGVGKEVFARAVHASGARRDGPFVAVDCASLPEGLVEAELFGYAPGAYTGARRDGAPGRIREAHGGTLFLDEIGDMPLGLQSRLLRVLQERRVTPLGGGRTVDADFALICATHRRLKDEVAAGRFRADLYYRVNGLTLSLPALRDRADLDALVARVLREASPGRHVTLDDTVAAAFARYAWPGNLRQLVTVLRTACALLDAHERVIGWQHLADDLADELRMSDSDVADVTGPRGDAILNLRALQDATLRRAIDASAGNMSAVARQLGISRNTLYRRLRDAGIPVPDRARPPSPTPAGS